jgi:hypothetical protein
MRNIDILAIEYSYSYSYKEWRKVEIKKAVTFFFLKIIVRKT